MPQEEKQRYADYLIDTSDGFESTRQRTVEVYQKLRQISRAAVMVSRKREHPLSRRTRQWRTLAAFVLLIVLAVSHAGCFGDEAPATVLRQRSSCRAHRSFAGVTVAFRKLSTPPFAAAPPDTDAVRALFEGLTDYDPKTLQPIPGVATRWESTADNRIWTFYLAKMLVGPMANP
jgi:hypothetical protein